MINRKIRDLFEWHIWAIGLFLLLLIWALYKMPPGIFSSDLSQCRLSDRIDNECVSLVLEQRSRENERRTCYNLPNSERPDCWRYYFESHRLSD